MRAHPRPPPPTISLAASFPTQLQVLFSSVAIPKPGEAKWPALLYISHCRIFSSPLLGRPHTSTGQEQGMEVAAGGGKDRVVEQGAAAGVTLHHGDDDHHQTASPVAPLLVEGRTHVPDLVPEVFPKRRANSATLPEENRARDGAGVVVPGEAAAAAAVPAPGEDCGRERLKRHRVAMAGRVWIPESWGHETLLKDWTDCAAVDRALVPNGLLSARKALVEECRRANSGGFRFESRCLST